MCGEVSTDFKSLNRIKISQLVQVLLNFYWFLGSPWGGSGWMGWEVVRGCSLHICTCTCMHACIHTHTCMYDIIGNSQGFLQWGQPFRWNYHVYHACMCVSVHMCMCVCVHMCMGHPSSTPNPIHPSPSTPRGTGSPKHQNSISLELIEIIRFCLKILYLWTLLNLYRL